MTELTKNEKRLLEILGRRKRTISDLAADFYKTRRFVPKAPNNSILHMLKQIAGKKGKRYLQSSGGMGCKGRTIWRSR